MNIKDIAKKAQVSTATVSNVLSGNKNVSDQLRERVLKVVEEYHYSPNVYARKLKLNKSNTIGVHVPDIINPFFSEIVRNICTVADNHGYQVMLCISDESVTREKTILDNFYENQVEGIVNIAPKLGKNILNTYDSRPMVIADRPDFISNNNIGFVYADNYLGGKIAADYLIQKGYQRFLCMMGPIESVPNAKKRVEGFEDELLHSGVDKNQIIIKSGEFSFPSGYQMMEDFISKLKDEKPVGAFLGSDVMAWGAIEALKTAGYTIPGRIGIIGYDNIYYSNYISPKLTTVQNSTELLGIKAISMLLNAIENGENLCGSTIKLQPLMVARESC